MLDLILTPLNWILGLWTIVGGPAIGFLLASRARDRGQSSRAAQLQGVFGGAIATALVLGSSYLLWLMVGIPAAWRWVAG